MTAPGLPPVPVRETLRKDIRVAQLLMTGFPGFLGSALLPRLLARRPGTDAVCLVQPQHAVLARSRVKELEITDPHTTGRITLVEGDITVAGLGPRRRPSATASTTCSEVWHLAAVYDLAVAPQIARRVNVDGTTNVLALLPRAARTCARLQYVSTCYVSGRYEGEFTEDALEVGQEFRNHYEETKYEAELLVRKAMADGIPATIYRPGIVVGDSQTGATQKYDGPYFLATFLARQPSVAVVPAVGDADSVRVCLVPRDFVVGAMDELSVLDESAGRTYALVDPDPPTVREVVDDLRPAPRLARWSGCRCRCARCTPSSSTCPAWSACWACPPRPWTTSPRRRRTRRTNTTRDLTASGLACPRFADLRRPPARLHAGAPRVRRQRDDLSAPPLEGMPLSAKRKTRVEPPLLVVEISLGSAERDHDVTVEFLGRPVRLLRIGTDGDLRTAETWCAAGRPSRTPSPSTGRAEAAATGADRRSTPPWPSGS